MTHWKIHLLEDSDSGSNEQKFKIGRVVAEVKAELGEVQLKIFDDNVAETLKNLFQGDQYIYIKSGDSRKNMQSESGKFLRPWQPETLEYIKQKLSSYGMIALDAQ